MDRTQLCGSCDVGSIPTEGTTLEKSMPRPGAYLVNWHKRQ